MNRRLSLLMLVPAFLAACTTIRTTVTPPAVEALPQEVVTMPQEVKLRPDHDVADVLEIPQRLDAPAQAAGASLSIDPQCRDALRKDFRARYFAPWTSTRPLYERSDVLDYIKDVGRGTWYGGNLRHVSGKILREIVDSCDLDSYPSRFDKAVAVAPAHLRGLPTRMPLFEKRNDYPFDMLQYPQLKLNEPLRILHATRDGAWLFVETPYTYGWVEARDVALVDREFVQNWMELPLVVAVTDNAPVAEVGGGVRFRLKVGTLLPLIEEKKGYREVVAATAGEGGKVRNAVVRIASEASASFPLEFDAENVARVGNSMLGQPYGWGEMYGLRDCSALLRDFFLPFGIWMPRTSADQIASVPNVVRLSGKTAAEKQEIVKREGRPFLTLLHKKGHIMLYVGTDAKGRLLAMHDAWSVPVKDGTQERDQIVGMSVVTTLEPGKELGLVEGRSLIDRITELATITKRCPTTQR